MSRKKIELDATGLAPGRLATKIAGLLIGKGKVDYTPNIDNGDKVVILNASKIHFTGKKIMQKVYRHHSLHPGGLKEIPARRMLAENPEEIIRRCVERMLPKNKTRSARLRRLVIQK